MVVSAAVAKMNLTASQLAGYFLVFEGAFLGLMMVYMMMMPVQAASSVLGIAEEQLVTMFQAIDSTNEAALKYFAWTVLDNDNQHGAVLFMALSCLTGGLFIEPKNNKWIFFNLVIAHGWLALNPMNAVTGNYYMDVPTSVFKSFQGPIMLHCAFMLMNLLLGMGVLAESSQSKKKSPQSTPLEKKEKKED